MKSYKSHKVVEAAPILLFGAISQGYIISVGSNPDEAVHVRVSKEFFARGEPKVGDYLVRYQPDGYLSWSPKDRFEAGYTPMDEESALVRYAKGELARIRIEDGERDELQDAIEANVLGIVREFAGAGHSGSSAPYTIGIVEKLLMYQPLTPLTGADDEWFKVGHQSTMLWQNKRCHSVFKRADGTAYDIDAIIKRWPDGGCTTGGRKDITFPYVPTKAYVDVDEKGEPLVDPEVQQRADILLALEAALVLLGRSEPGDSRAVSDQFVAMGAALAGCMNEEGRQILRKILLSDDGLTKLPVFSQDPATGQLTVPSLKTTAQGLNPQESGS